MSYIEKAIREAVRGGWNPKPYYYSPIEISARGITMSGGEGDREFYQTNTLLLDPQFWQCLGKARGFPPNPPMRDQWWQVMWHRFIDHLAEGKDSESFFEELLHTNK